METASQTAIIDRVAALVQPILTDNGLELFEIQFRQESNDWVLRLLIDSEKGITLEDCSRVSRETGNLLEIEDVITHPYHLEVSSPGLNRPLRNEKDFLRFTGKLAKIKVNDPVQGKRVIVGRIALMDNGLLTIKTDKESIAIPLDQITKARLEVEF